MARHTSGNVGLAATVIAVLASSVAFANPEAGGDASQTTRLVTITSADANAPTILRTVVIKCPVAGLLIANADAAFQLSFSTGSSFGVLEYGISRTTAFDNADDHQIEVLNPNIIPLSIPGSIQRFDNCKGGQTITYRFVAFLHAGLSSGSDASQPRLSVIFLRDRD